MDDKIFVDLIPVKHWNTEAGKLIRLRVWFRRKSPLVAFKLPSITSDSNQNFMFAGYMRVGDETLCQTQ